MKTWICLRPTCGFKMVARKRPKKCPICGKISHDPKPERK